LLSHVRFADGYLRWLIIGKNTARVCQQRILSGKNVQS
jgi:hypothetical protein